MFTKRTASLANHPGQVSFPGGKRQDDESPRETALREASEEIALNPQKCEVLGCLAPSLTLVGSFKIVPVVAIYHGNLDELIRNDDEVEMIFTVSLEEFFEPSSHRVVNRVTSRYGAFEVHYFDISKEVIWGATAKIVWDFLTLLTTQ